MTETNKTVGAAGGRAVSGGVVSGGVVGGGTAGSGTAGNGAAGQSEHILEVAGLWKVFAGNNGNNGKNGRTGWNRWSSLIGRNRKNGVADGDNNNSSNSSSISNNKNGQAGRNGGYGLTDGASDRAGRNGLAGSNGQKAAFELSGPEAAAALKEQGAVPAVTDVSFKVERGQVFIIMGLSGSGKSTLIRCIPRLVEPSQGELSINGRNILKLNDQELTDFRRTDIAMVFQHYGLLPHRNVLENVCFGLKLRGMPEAERRDRARQVISRVGLEGWEQHYPAQLSGGMRQRVGIARALVQESSILLMDEPFSGLDPLIRREMQDLLVRLQREEQKTIVFVTHDLNEAVHLGDRMAVMKNGVFVQQGTPQEVIAHPADEYVERFVSNERQMAAGSGFKVKPLISVAATPRRERTAMTAGPVIGPLVGSAVPLAEAAGRG